MKLWNSYRVKITRSTISIRLGAVLGLSLALLGIALARPSAIAAQEKPAVIQVTIDNYTFTPKELTIPAGTQVTWTNKDDVPHTVVSVDKKFKSKALDTDETFSFTFSDPGTYAYFCSVHPTMTGKIIVK
jgi:plastocyanin